MNYYESDLKLMSEVRKYGKFDAEGCFNCGSCTLACELSQDQATFPRRPMRLVITGVKQALHQSIDPWVCHDCGDCSTACPRETKPQESMMTLRRYLVSVYDWTGIASLINRSKGWYLGSLSIVAAIVLLLIVIYHLYAVNMSFSELTTTGLGVGHMFPTITYFTWVVILLPLLILLTNAARMYGMVSSRMEQGRGESPSFLSRLLTFFVHFFTYKKMAECPTGKSRWLEHLFIGLGCLMMLFVKVFALNWFQTDEVHPFFHPQRWIGYLATCFLLYGTGSILIDRIKKEKEVYKSSELQDWIFLLLLFGTALSGIILHVCRISGLQLATCYTYTLHLIFAVPMLVIEMPFGKWTHMIYRPLAIAIQTKKGTVQPQWSQKEVSKYATA